MAKKLIPNGDVDFRTMVTAFASTIGNDPQRYEVSAEEFASLRSALGAFEQALLAARSSERTPRLTGLKDKARADLERILRPMAQVIRANPRIDPADKAGLNLAERQKRSKHVSCPQESPRLKFMRSRQEGASMPVHELIFSRADFSRRPAGVTRIELFVDLVPPEEEIPKLPGANLGGRSWYLRSFTKSPIKLTPPLPRVPMRVVYWARWADSLGNVGPFSATAAGPIEGGTHYLMSNQQLRMHGHLLESDLPEPEERDQRYSVVVLTAQVESLRSTVDRNHALPQPVQRELRQIEGPEAA